jgi:hypothetical protein
VAVAPRGAVPHHQGLHVATGIASIPLLLAKLWTVYPHLWTWPPVRSVTHALERVSLVPLVAGSLFMLTTGGAVLATIRRVGPSDGTRGRR